MKFFSANIESLRELYTKQLQMLLCAEQELIDALTEMIEKATDDELKAAFESHLLETEVQITRLEQILNAKLSKAEPLSCKGIESLIAEAESLVKDATDESVRDVVIIAAAQRLEHYEIAAYGAARSWARILGEFEDASLLDKTIQEEEHADHILTEISDRINTSAEAAQISNARGPSCRQLAGTSLSFLET